MPDFTKSGTEIWRDYNTPDVPSSGAHRPWKSEIRLLMAEMEAFISALLPLIGGGSGGATDIVVTPSVATGRNRHEFRLVVRDNDGRIVQGWRDDGTPVFPLAEFLAAAARGRSGREFLWALKDRADRVMFGLADDGAWLRLSARGARELSQQLYVPPSAFRGSHGALLNLRCAPGELLVATTQDAEGQVYDILQRRRWLAAAHAIADAAARAHVMLWQGQSNNGPAPEAAPLIADTAFPHHSLSWDNYLYQYGDAALAEYTVRDLRPSFEPPSGSGNSTGFATAEALVRFDRDAGRQCPGYITHVDWYGGQPLSSFADPSTGWDNLLKTAENSVRLAALYGRPAEVKAINFIQGEGGPNGRSTYGAALGDYIDDVAPAVQAAAGQASAPKFLFMQTCDGDNDSTPSGVELGQYDVAKARAGAGVVLVGSMYPYPVIENVHHTNLGHLMMGDLWALVYEEVAIKGNAFAPLWPTLVQRTGANIDITFSLPAGNLALDTDWLPATDNHGFSYTDDGTPPSISSVSIIASNQVRVTLSGTPTGANKKLRYGLAGTPQVTGWQAGRGNLYSPTTRRSAFWRRGYAVPEFIRHYCVRFEEAVP